MRKLLFVGLLAVAFMAFGCGSNPAGSITGPTQEVTALNLASPPTTLPAPEPLASPGFYGTVSNLSAAGFTLTSPDGRTLDVTASPGTMVLFQGDVTDLASSPLADGMNVAVNGTVSGLPEHAMVRALLVVINSSVSNRDIAY